MALGQNFWLMQAGSLVGFYGLTLLALAICAAPAVLLTGTNPARRWTAPVFRPRRCWRCWPRSALWRLPAGPVGNVESVRLRIMQPNLPQDAKFNPRNRDAIMRRYLAISRYAGQAGETLERRRT